MEQNKYFLPVSVIAAGLLIAGAVVWNGSRPATTGPKPVAVDIANVDIAGRPFIGNPDAPVTIAFWSDFQCPFCKQFETGGVDALTQRGITSAFPEVVKNYVDTGKVKVVFMDFAFLGEDSFTAAVYSHAVWKLYPNQYHDWRIAMYKAQDEEHAGFGDEASIKKLSATIPGIDAAVLAAEVSANRSAYDALIDADKAEAAKVGISATPASVIGKQVISGAQPYSVFQTALDALLK